MSEDERRKLVWNQQVFERANESIRDLAAEARVTGPISFLCECADTACRAEIRLTLPDYRRTHGRPGRFVLVRGHETADIERVVEDEGAYVVVEKMPSLLHGLSQHTQ